MTHRINSCRSCDARIIWARTRNDISMPLDADPSVDGNALLHDNGTVDVFGPLELSIHDHAAQPLRMPHHATCPDAEEWHR